MSTRAAAGTFEDSVRRADASVSWQLKVALVVFVAVLQLGNFYLGYKIYALMPSLKYLDFETAWDRLIPYLRWSWTIYYFGFAYVVFWGTAGIWNLTRRPLYRTIAVYSVLVLVGAVLHLVLPSRAPWERIADLTVAQQSFKANCRIEPLACFPSMHVAMSVLPALISCYRFRSRFQKWLSVVLALAVSTSVVTAREHWFLDAVGGVVLGILSFWVWRKYALRPERGTARTTLHLAQIHG